ncbi:MULTISPECIES: response regulator [unclassified Sphingomonas]|uniref:response regulator transcription factor n=1 Tax=unclassified Sphingomonas TaxID=196159 RepID=UPI00226A78BA|nr:MULTISPECIES: response regulator [unclassified Sphingomonas]
MPHEREIYIVDDEPEMCRSLALLLATDGMPARCFSSADQFLDALDFLKPGIIISDVMMPGLSGIDLLRIMPVRHRSDPVIVIAGHADIPLAVEALKAGAIDFIEKPFAAATILRAVEDARGLATHDDDNHRPIDQLSRRERQTLEFIVGGLTTKEAARRLAISPRTIETYRAKLMSKTGASSTADLIKIALRAGLEVDQDWPTSPAASLIESV